MDKTTSTPNETARHMAANDNGIGVAAPHPLKKNWNGDEPIDQAARRLLFKLLRRNGGRFRVIEGGKGDGSEPFAQSTDKPKP